MNFIFDLDGTICFKGQKISSGIADLLVELEQAGHVVGFASARPCRDMLPVLDERLRNRLLIGANGAMTYFGGELQASVPIPAGLAKELLHLLQEFDAEYLIDDRWNYACRMADSHPFLRFVDPDKLAARIELDQIESYMKIVVLSGSDFGELSRRLERMDVTIHHHSTEGILDLTYKGVNKMSALELSGIPGGPFVCFGNDMNDLPLFEKAHHSVAIGDYEPLLRIAKERIPADEHTECSIIRKLRELGERYA
ncbi:HAD-IIB family hydrolase [Paenibacillus sp. GCM10012303]|uniref:HAD-IIB family hydrolase n=1 Tax=Paenibacillus sp. GCM10012303 TaxID=3317340 RepID=UPI0036225F49